MYNLYNIMMEAQNGQAVDRLSKQFNLTPEQTRHALELMMPAFSTGLKRNTADPHSLMNFMSHLSNGTHQKYHDGEKDAFQQEAIEEGNQILGEIFGSKDTSRAVADQVAFASGIGPTILKQMLPVVASMIMGGLFKNAANGRTAAPSNPMGDLLGSFLETLMQGGLQNQTRPSQPEQPRAQPKSHANPYENNPFGKMFEDFMGTMTASKAPPEKPRMPERGEDVFGQMFESGRKVQDQYQKNIDNIFDTFLDGMRRRQ